jgi:hypothetical protein
MNPEKHFILFTGHMIDKVDRSVPRFPASKEHAAKEAIVENLKRIKALGKKFFGIAGGACGGDIIFHESAAELNIPSALHLISSPGKYVKESVAFAGQDWIDRFNTLCQSLPVYIMPASGGYPGDDFNTPVYEKANLWMLHKALQNGGSHLELLALWNGKAGDGAGGTDHMVITVEKAGGGVSIIDTNKLFDL